MQSNNQQQQQYSQHPLSSQQSQSSSQHLQQQEKIIGSGGIVADGSMANTLQGNDQVFYYWLSDSNFMKLYVLFMISFFFFPTWSFCEVFYKYIHMSWRFLHILIFTNPKLLIHDICIFHIWYFTFVTFPPYITCIIILKLEFNHIFRVNCL